MINIFNTLFVTMFGLGKIRLIPGTFGSLATIIILYVCFHILEINSDFIFVGLIIIFIYSFSAVTQHTKIVKIKILVK
jgi:phosphatidylglycerophosphatase A